MCSIYQSGHPEVVSFIFFLQDDLLLGPISSFGRLLFRYVPLLG